MHFEEGYTYHIYNRGINHEKVFFSDANYTYFINKMKCEIVPICDILAYCLLPNHFHFLIQANKKSCLPYQTKSGNLLNTQNLSKRFGLILSSYSQGINRRRSRTGNLFQQRTKAKCLNLEFSKNDYLRICFLYIHQNPLEAGLTNKLEDWPYSSFIEYLSKSNNGLCNQELTKEMIHLDWDNFHEQSKYILDNKEISGIF